MNQIPGPLAVDGQFFAALLRRDVPQLTRILSDDFLLIDVMSGAEITKTPFLEVLGGGQLEFETIDPVESRERRYGSAAVITGRTEMRGRFGETPFGVRSRYTHVYVEKDGAWRLASAQGTPIAPGG